MLYFLPQHQLWSNTCFIHASQKWIRQNQLLIKYIQTYSHSQMLPSELCTEVKLRLLSIWVKCWKTGKSMAASNPVKSW